MHRLGGRNEVNLTLLLLLKHYFDSGDCCLTNFFVFCLVFSSFHIFHIMHSPVLGWSCTHGGDEDFPRMALSPLLLHLAQPEGQPESAHSQQARQPWRILCLHVLREASFLKEQPAGSHITGKQRPCDLDAEA